MGDSGKRLIFLVAALVALVFTCAVFLTFSAPREELEASVAGHHVAVDDLAGKAGLLSLLELNVTEFGDRPFLLHHLRKHFANREETEQILQAIEDRCSRLPQSEQVQDIRCTALWLHHLRDDAITGVDRWWGFDDTHFGAITLRLGSMRAMFKPCTSKSEDTTKEVVASSLDQLLGWGQTAPAITRRIPVDDLRQLAKTPEALELFENTTQCAVDGYFVGPMMGWWDGLIPVRTLYKKEKSLPLLKKWRNTMLTVPQVAQMQSKYHAFYLLVNILRHGKDEFITRDGHLVSLDLDRARFSSSPDLVHPTVNFTWCFACVMDRWVYDTFRLVGPTRPETKRLGYLMKQMLSYDDIFTDLWSERMGKALDKRVASLLSCIDDCIHEYGRENVLIEDPKQMSTRSLVQFFITNSDYRDQNGQRGPENVDALLAGL